MSSIHMLIPDLGSSDDRVRQNAADQLVKAGPQVVPALMGVLRDRKGRHSIHLRTSAARLLGEIGDSTAVDPLRETFEQNLLILAQSLDPAEIRKRRLFDNTNRDLSFLHNRFPLPQYVENFESRGAFGAEILAAVEKISAINQIPDANGNQVPLSFQQHCSTCGVEFFISAGGIVIGAETEIIERINRRPTYCSSCDKVHCLGCAYDASKVRNLEFNCCPDCGDAVPDDWAPNSGPG